MTEPDAAITDYVLTVEAIGLAALLAQRTSIRPELQGWFVTFFAAAAAASLAGGTVHGFFQNSASCAATILWRTVLVAIGVAALSAWLIGALLVLDRPAVRFVRAAANVEFICYVLLVVAVKDAFWVAIANYLPSTLFLLVAFALIYRRQPISGVAVGLAGLLLTLVAAGIQQARVALHPVYFNHNALYHVLQGMALFMIFWAARALI